MAKSTAHANAVLDLLGSGTTMHNGTYISLHTGDPGTTGASEVTGGSYARVQVNQDGGTSPYWNTAGSATMDNNGAITFPEGGGDAAVTHFGIWDGASPTAFIRGGALDAGFTYSASTTPQFASGDLDLTEA